MSAHRKRFSTDELRRLADSAGLPLPWPQSRREDIQSALRYCADLIDAADSVVSEQQKGPQS